MTLTQCCSYVWKTFVIYFGFTSRRKYGFLHSSWETVRARKTGSPASCLDYVVYRLFYTLALCAVGVLTIGKSNPYNFFFFLETWVLLAHIVYGFIFLRQVLAHNHYRRELGRGQKMPEELFITDEIERDGKKYYISKKLSVLTRGPLSAYEKVIWISFNTVITLSITVCLAQGHFFNILIPCKQSDIENQSRHTFLLALISVVEIFATSLPMRTGHFFQPLCFLMVYCSLEYWFEYRDTNCKGKFGGAVYRYSANSYPKWLHLIILTIACHVIVHLLKLARDFLISIFDLTRTQAVQQRLRAQKRLARRKIMHEIRGPNGKVQRIFLEHVTPSQEDLICWRENAEEVEELDWAGDSEPDLNQQYRISQDPVLRRPGFMNAPPAMRYPKLHAILHHPRKTGLEIAIEAFNKTGKKNHKNHVADLEAGGLSNPQPGSSKRPSGDYERALNINLPSPPTNDRSDLDRKDPNAIDGNAATGDSARHDKVKLYTEIAKKENSPATSFGRKGPHGTDTKKPSLKAVAQLVKAVHRFKSQGRKSQFGTGEADLELEHERKEYSKKQRLHELDRLTYHYQRPVKLHTQPGASNPRNPGPPIHHYIHHPPMATQGILKQKRGSTSAGNEAKGHADKKPLLGRTQKRKKLESDPVYDPLGVPEIPHVSATFHYLDTKLDPQGTEGTVPAEDLHLYKPETAIRIKRSGHNKKSKTKAARDQHTTTDQASPGDSIVSFHPLVQYFNVPYEPHQRSPELNYKNVNDAEQHRRHPEGTQSNRKGTILLSNILGKSPKD